MSWIRIQSSEESSTIAEFTIQKSQIPEFRKTTEKIFGPELSQQRIIVWVASRFSVLFPHESKISFHFSDFLNSSRQNIPGMLLILTVGTGCPIKKATQAFGSCSRTRVPILFKFTMDIVWTMAKNVVTKANSLGVLPHLECVWLRRLHFCFFHRTLRSLPKKFSWDHPKTRLDVEKCPEQKDKSLRTPFASNYDRIRLWDVREGCQPPFICHLFGNTTVYKFLLSREYFIIYDRKQ